MAKITRLRVLDRRAGWDQAPFTSGSHSQAAGVRETLVAARAQI